MHAFFKEIKRILRNVFDLKRVKIGFSDDSTTQLNKFILEVYRLLGCDPVRQGIFVVIFDGPALLFAGVICLRLDLLFFELHDFLGIRAVDGFTFEFIAFTVVLEHLPVDFIHGRRFELHAAVVLALLSKERRQPKADQERDKQFPAV